MWKQSLCVVLLLAGCKKEPPAYIESDDIAVGWRSMSADLEETAYMALRADRQLEVVAKQRDGSLGKVQGRLSEDRYSKLIEELRTLDCCSLKSASPAGSRPSASDMPYQLEVHADGMDCVVTRWTSEWQEGRAQECASAVDGVHGQGFFHAPSPKNPKVIIRKDPKPAADDAQE
jgi:hypothetical protein